MARMETWFEQDLKKPLNVRMLTGNLFSMDNEGNLIGVTVLDGGQPAELAGDVSANVIRCDGGTVAVTGTLEDNKAFIVLPQAAYAVPGLVTIIIKLTNDGVITTLAAMTAIVYRSSTDTIIDPGTIIPSIQTLISSIDTAVASIPADYSSMISALSLYGVNRVSNLSFEQGNINSSTGQQTTSNKDKRIRSRYYYYVPLGFSFTVPDGFRAIIYYYDREASSGYIGYNAEWLTGSVSVNIPKGAYIRVVVSKTDDSNLTPSDITTPIQITKKENTDDSLTEQYKAADAKATGDKFDQIVSVIKETHTDDLTLVQGSIKSTTGGNTDSSTRLRTDLYYDCAFGFGVEIPEGLKAVVQYYTDQSYLTHVASSSWLTGEINVKYPEGRYVRFVIANNDDSAIIPDDIDEPITLTRETLFDQNAEVVETFQSDSWGIANVLARSAHISEIKWTPVGYMPKTTDNNSHTDPSDVQYFSIAQQTGIPYSSVRDQDKAVGMDVSIHTFMTAVRDPNSVLYKRLSTVNNSTTYYGTVCSGMINYADGIGLDLTNFYLSESDMFETIPMQSIQKGDMIWVDGHCALVYNVEKDQFGRISKVVIREEWRPLPRTVTYKSWAKFMNSRGDYIARRFKNNAGVGYTAIPYVQCFDEVPPDEIVYPNVQTDHGDAAVFKVGENVKINVIDDSDFTTITVKRGETTVFTTNTIESFTLENVQAGLYTITANGGDDESVSTFFVVDCTGSFDLITGIVTFSSTNATPVLVNVYDLPNNRKVTCKPIILTDADRSAGQIDVSDYIDTTHKYAKVTFLTEYGTAVWYSESHEKWVPIGG